MFGYVRFGEMRSNGGYRCNRVEPSRYNGKLELDSKFGARNSTRDRSSIVFLTQAQLKMKIELLELAQLGSIPNYSVLFLCSNLSSI